MFYRRNNYNMLPRMHTSPGTFMRYITTIIACVVLPLVHFFYLLSWHTVTFYFYWFFIFRGLVSREKRVFHLLQVLRNYPDPAGNISEEVAPKWLRYHQLACNNLAFGSLSSMAAQFYPWDTALIVYAPSWNWTSTNCYQSEVWYFLLDYSYKIIYFSLLLSHCKFSW